MTKKDYIWNFSATMLIAGLNETFSLEYHLVAAKLKVAPQDLIDSRLWLVMQKGGHSYMYALLMPSSIELYKEGLYVGDFLIRSSPFCSFRLLPRLESVNPWELSSLLDSDEGLRECKEEETNLFLKMLSTNYRTSFAPPPVGILGSVPRTSFTDLSQAVPDQLILTMRALSFGDASRSQSFPSALSAFGGIALSVLKLAQPHLNSREAEKLMALLDPLPPIQGQQIRSTQEILAAFSSFPPVVDTFLEEIDPEKISPRNFIAGSSMTSLDWLSKTNEAEEMHEKILKDVVLRFKSRDYSVSKSRSFDLFAEKANIKLLWEIKSATGDNFVAQGEKGIIQLLRYSIALEQKNLVSLRLLLLIQDCDQPAVFGYLSRMAARVGIELWLYNENQEWPYKIFNQEVKTFSGL
jgi:hypothetical protein